MFNSGDVAYVKSSGETVTVLQMAPVGPDNLNSYMVRRPHNTRNTGIHHEREVFYEIELETQQEHIDRDTRELYMKIESQNEVLVPLIKKIKKEKLSAEDYTPVGFALPKIDI